MVEAPKQLDILQLHHFLSMCNILEDLDYFGYLIDKFLGKLVVLLLIDQLMHNP
jgi:hypothetical protein